MEFHPQKCSILRIYRPKTNPKTFQYQLKGVALAEEQSSKYLGVDIQSNLTWNDHINRITKKSNSMLGFQIATYGKQARKPKPRPTSQWSDPTLTTVAQSGIPTTRSRLSRLIWSSAGLHDL